MIVPETDLFESVVPANSRMAEHRYIFVGGLHRSGTTPLFELLRDHPSVSGFRIPGGAEREHEGQIHQTVYPRGVETGGPGYFCLAPGSSMDEESALATRANAEKLFSEWSSLWDLSKPFLLEKSPPNLIRTRFLQRLFPNSYFVVIVRHPVPVTLATMKWMGWPRFVLTPSQGATSDAAYTVRQATPADKLSFYDSRQLMVESMLFTLFEHWRRGHARYLEDTRFLRRSVTVRYEDLVSNPDPIAEKLHDFLDLPPNQLDLRSRLSSHNDRYFQEWSSMPADELTPAFRQFLANRFQPFASRFGYSLEDGGWISDWHEESRYQKIA